MIPMMLFPSSTREELLELRRDLHRHPELSFQEERTAAKLYESLARLKPKSLDRIAGTGVVARLEGRDDGRLEAKLSPRSAPRIGWRVEERPGARLLFPRMLAPGGSLVVSLPNVAYLPVRLGLLFGRFDYRDAGILDRTHLRFFTLASARGFLADHGWREVEMRPSSGRLPYHLARLRPTLLSPQFVFRLTPTPPR